WPVLRAKKSRHAREGGAHRLGLSRWRVTPCVSRSRAREETRESRGMPCLSLTPSGVLAENHPKNRGFVGILQGQKCLKRRFSRRSPVGEWSRGARSMPRVFGTCSSSQPAALVSDRDDAALFPAIRILERYGSAKSGGARRVRTACRRQGDPKRSSTICCRSFGLRARPSKASLVLRPLRARNGCNTDIVPKVHRGCATRRGTTFPIKRNT